MIFVILLVVVIMFISCVTIILDQKDSQVLINVDDYTDDLDALFDKEKVIR